MTHINERQTDTERHIDKQRDSQIEIKNERDRERRRIASKCNSSEGSARFSITSFSRCSYALLILRVDKICLLYSFKQTAC